MHLHYPVAVSTVTCCTSTTYILLQVQLQRCTLTILLQIQLQLQHVVPALNFQCNHIVLRLHCPVAGVNATATCCARPILLQVHHLTECLTAAYVEGKVVEQQGQRSEARGGWQKSEVVVVVVGDEGCE